MMNANIAQQDRLHVVVVGGGITGMSAAYTLQKEVAAADLPLAITLVDAGQKLGGKIVTDQADGFTVEGGPDCFIRSKPWVNELAAELGIQDDLMGTNDHQRKTFVLNHGRLTPLPDGVMLLIPTKIRPFVVSPLISWPGKIRMGLDFFIPRRKDASDETIGSFVRRRLGGEALDKIAEPLLSGIHVSDPEKQSLLATFPRFRDTEDKYGSLVGGMLAEKKAAPRKKPNGAKPLSMFMTFKQGLGRLPQALEAALTDCAILRGTEAVSIERGGPAAFTVRLNDGQTLPADALILATPAHAAAQMLGGIAPQTAGLLNGIEYVSTATVSLGFRVKDIRRPFMGFGFVIPKSEKRKISACTWTSYKFNHRAPEEHLLLRVFVGGPGKEEMVELDDESLVRTVREELRQIMGLDAEPVVSRIYRWRKANPQYNLGHLERVRSIFEACRREAPGVRLTGAAYEGVGVPDCVNQGKKAAQEAIQFLQKEFAR